MSQEEMTVDEYRTLKKESKYRNKKVTIDGYEFDSLAEARRYEQLKLMEQAGAISDLRLQPKYELQRGFTDGSGVKHRAITYVADFAYNADGLRVVEDLKGAITKEYAIKKKLFLFKYFDLTFREIKAK
jgi:hypothetical protein